MDGLGEVDMKRKPLLIAVFLTVLFCVSFVVLFLHFQSRQQLAAAEPQVKADMPLPDVTFSDAKGNQIPENDIKKGKVVMVFLE